MNEPDRVPVCDEDCGQVTTLDWALPLITTQTCSPGNPYQHPPFDQ